MHVKYFVAQQIKNNPSRFGADNGAYFLINDFFVSKEWTPLTTEQHKAIAGLIRSRNYFLNDNEAFDQRSKRTSYEHKGQTSIYDFLEADTAMQFQRITYRWSIDPQRINEAPSYTKKCLRGVDYEHIEAVRLIHPLLIANPKIKQKRVKKSPNIEAIQSTDTTAFIDDKECEVTASFDEDKQG